MITKSSSLRRKEQRTGS